MSHTVTLNSLGQPLTVNPIMVGGVMPYENQPETASVLYLGGQRVRVRGHYKAILAALSWESDDKALVGFGKTPPGDPDAHLPGTAPSQAPGAPTTTELPDLAGDGSGITTKGGSK